MCKTHASPLEEWNQRGQLSRTHRFNLTLGNHSIKKNQTSVLVCALSFVTGAVRILCADIGDKYDLSPLPVIDLDVHSVSKIIMVELYCGIVVQLW